VTRVAPDEVIATLGLRPLAVEGGLWAQTWRDEHCTSIYYLLVTPEFSAMHRLAHTEVYVHHAGAPVRMLLLHQDGSVTRPELGTDLAAGQRPQVGVAAGVWQGSRSLGEWSLLGTVVAPPYTDDIVEFGAGDALAHDYPAHANEIRALCRDSERRRS
jgi:predicted cupin superfamily sugar epimerase